MKQIKNIMKGMVLMAVMVCFSSLNGNAQDTGEITGNISDSVETVIGAVVVVEGNNALGALTDEEGNFSIKKIKPGTYTIVVTYFGYKNIVIKDVKVEAGQATSLGNVKMQSDMVETAEATVIGTKTTNTEAAGVKETKESKSVVNVITAEQISKSQDRDVAQVMQRVPGVTIIENKFVLIRGLPERYNAVMINDVTAPNTEVDRRSFSFDLIPSQMLDRVTVYKSGAADLPGDFAAGVIKVYTKGIPDRNYFNVSLTGGYRNGTTFKDHNSNYKGNTEFLGFGDKSRNLPESFPSNTFLNGNTVTDADKQEAALLLPNRFGYTTNKATPDLRLNVDLGRRFTVGNVKIGNVTSLNYSNVYQRQLIERYDYLAYDSTKGKSDLRTRFDDQRTVNTVRLGLIHNWSFIVNARNKIEFKNFFNQQGENEAIVRNGIDFGRSADDSIRSYSYRYTSRRIFTSQLGAKHDFNQDRSSFSWALGYSNIKRNIPDWIRFRTYKKIGTNEPYRDIAPSAAALFENARFNSDLNESTLTARGDFEHKFADADSIGASIKAGFYIESKSREFAARWMSLKPLNNNSFTEDNVLTLPIDQIFSPEVIGSANGFKIEDGTNATDKYSASNQLFAGYLSGAIPLRKFNVQAGLRVEGYHQVLSSGATKIDTFIVTPLPFLNTSYNLTKKSLVRFSYGRTVNRPEFRELAPFLYYDFDLNTNFSGNPALKICTIHNLDLRWELYPSSNEMVSFGVFYKNFNNPIEIYSIGTSPRQFKYGNAAFASNVGVELEVRKSLESISNNKIIKNISLLFNGSLISSKVDLNLQAVNGKFTEANTRPLQGQSPYVINTGLYYFNEDNGLSISALYNIFGKRIFIVGDNQGNANIYEMPRHSLDLTIQKKLSKHWEGRVGVQDLLNYKTRYVQDTNGDSKITSIDETFSMTRRGTYINLGIQYRF